MALEFMLHIILPIAVVLGFIAGFSHICAIIIDSGVQSDFLTSSPKLEISMLIADFVVLLLLVSGYLGVPIPGGKLSITFFTYMITLFRAQALIVRGTSLHRWEQVPSVRDELAEFDRKSQQK